MKVRVRLFGKYLENNDKPEFSLEVEPGKMVRDLAEGLTITETPDCWVLINGMRSSFEANLSDGDEICFFQPVGGG